MVGLRAAPALACANPVSCENQLPGTPPSDWQENRVGSPGIQGFATSMSVNIGGTVSFKINTPSTAYHIDILRLGYYQGNGARKIVSAMRPTVALPQTQPACMTDSSTGLIDCGNWGVSVSWQVPANAVSGVYIAHLVRDDGTAAGTGSQIPFVVRNDAGHSDIVMSTSDATWEAYNNYGGNSLYTCTVACPPGNPLAYKAAYAVSYNRPFDGGVQVDGGASYLYYAEYQMVRFLERNGYDLSYVSSGDVDRDGASLLNHKVFFASGHDEYWSANQRTNVEAARDAGVSLGFFSGNEIFWKTRFATSIDGTNTAYRTLVSYKETHFSSPVDPQGPKVWTGTWRDPRWSPPGDGGRPENLLTGQLFDVNSGTTDLKVPYAYSKLRIWRNTSAAQLASGGSLTLGAGIGTLGYEWDVDADNGYRPSGLFDLSATTATNVQTFTDYGSTVQNNTTATHHLVEYRAPSGALVFGAGTVQWAWGLDNTNAWGDAKTDPSGLPPDPNMQQATVNLLADMRSQPDTPLAGLVPATSSTDTLAPSSTIASPSAGTSVGDGSVVTISGTATDQGGGVVAGVEVSTDGGAHWHPATGTNNWSYSWIAHGSPASTIRSRAVDDSGNLETPAGGVSVQVTCACSLWGNAVTPQTIDGGDASAVEVGVRFSSDVYGQVTGVRFYKSAANTGTHVGNLWTSNGQLMARATFTGESVSGWQDVTFSSPVIVQPNTVYVASYYAPAGHYSVTPGYFYNAPSPPPLGGGSIDSAPLHAVSWAAGGDGMFAYNGSTVYPNNSYNANNYWVDVSFTPLPAAGQVTGVAAIPGFQSAQVNWSSPATGGQPTTYTITPYVGSTAQTQVTLTGTPPATSTTISGLSPGTPYTFTVQASNPTGAGPPSSPSAAVTPTGPSAPAAPSGVSAIGESAKALVSWTAPSANGSAITGYTITPYVGSTAQTSFPVSSGSATSATVTGLVVGQAYTFTVSATNGYGPGPNSAPSNAVTPLDSILDQAAPAVLDSGDGNGVTLGTVFTADMNGTVTGVRFYKSPANTGTHIGILWGADGTQLASGTFAGETTSGWQAMTFASPVAITAGTQYVVGYYAPRGRYSPTSKGYLSAIDNPPLHGVSSTTAANGVYAYGSAPAFPRNTYNSTNYFVDLTFQPSLPTAPTNVVAGQGLGGSATVSWTAPSGAGATSYTVTPYLGSVAQTPTTVTGAPPATTATITGLTAGTAYSFTVKATNSVGTGPESALSNAVTPGNPTPPGAPTGVSAAAAGGQAQLLWTAPLNNGSAITGYTVTPYVGGVAGSPTQVGNGAATSAVVTGLTNGTAYTFTVTATNQVGAGPASTQSGPVTPRSTLFGFPTPATVDSGDTNAVELGVRFTSDNAGQILGLRFYKSAGNTGAHVVNLWSSAGQNLATASVANESASGWQTAMFPTPVSIAAATSYVASYYAPSGHYSATPSAFNVGVDNPPLHAPATSVAPNGLYAYGSASTFPQSSNNATDYGIDVLFAPTAPTAPTGVTATAGVRAATVSFTAPQSGPAAKYTITPYIGTTAQPATTITGSPAPTNATVTGLTQGTTYTFTVSASNAVGTSSESAASNAVTPTGPTVPDAPSSVTALPGTGQALVSWTPPASNGGSALTGYTITPSTGGVVGTSVQVTDGTATTVTVPGLANGTAYTFAVAASNAVGTGPASTASPPVTPQATIFDFGKPAIADAGDASGVEVGVKFKADANGKILGLRFYKAAGNAGSHVVGLWDASGTQLATATATNETASGWQYVYFATAVAVTGGATYVAGYYAPNGHYSSTPQGFSSQVDNGALHALAGSVPGGNGIYSYGPAPVFPASTYNATNYWVDVIYQTP